MTEFSFEDNLNARAQLFKALGHPARLLIINLIAMKPRHGEELAMILSLKPATISHHLGKLTDVGLLQAQKDQYYQVYSLRSRMLQRDLQELVHVPQPDLQQLVEQDAYRYKVLKTFFKHGRITQLPAQLKKRRIIMERLVEEIEPNREYSEQEFNAVLREFHEDFATLRRELVEEGHVARSRGRYWRIMKQDGA